MGKILSSISCNLDENILSAALPLFKAEKIEAIEWSFDTLFKLSNIPDWFTELLTTFGNKKRLIGHGVYFSLFSGGWTDAQHAWLQHLEKVSAFVQFDHISEHFGFMTGSDFHQGAPLPIPFTHVTMAIGRDRLKRISQSCKCPVGLENLAFAFSPEDVAKQGEFLDQLLEPVNGFIILDLHNLYCQAHNFGISLNDLLRFYPLNRVREIHISGGSWENSQTHPGKKIRRDTHDDTVPEEVFHLLISTIPQCPNLKFLVMEQLGNGLDTEYKQILFRQDFAKMKDIAKIANSRAPQYFQKNEFRSTLAETFDQPLEDSLLKTQQTELSNILETASTYEHAVNLLQSSSLSNTGWETEKWEPFMVETAIAIAQKWKNGFA
ncbi:MAG: DUF692 family multinuclear iron-containing protein [Ferruginibacter sp.]